MMNHSRSADWLRSNLRCAMNAEQAQVKLSHPRMKQLLTALDSIGQVFKDDAWMRENDPNRRLKQALEALVHVTSIRSR